MIKKNSTPLYFYTFYNIIKIIKYFNTPLKLMNNIFLLNTLLSACLFICLFGLSSLVCLSSLDHLSLSVKLSRLICLSVYLFGLFGLPLVLDCVF